MTDDLVADLFAEKWREQLADAAKRSPSFTPDDYVATGRAPAAYGGKRNADWWLDNGPEMVHKWLAWRAETDWAILDIGGEPAIEVELNFTLPGDYPVKAFIDAVFVLPSGEVAVCDWKTGRTPETGEQLGLYRVGMGLVHDIWPEWGYYWTPDKGHGQPIHLGKYSPDYFANLFDDTAAGINVACFPPKPNNGCARWCSVARYCHAVGGQEAVGVDPLSLPYHES